MFCSVFILLRLLVGAGKRKNFWYAWWWTQGRGTTAKGIEAQLAKARKTKASKNLEQQVIVFAHAVP